jgi:antitoxin component YwqK of YwqJK toxin-antitoxin module
MKGPTLGYAVARQAPNGMIHLITTMNNPCLDLEFNEAWIMDSRLGERSDRELMASKAKSIASVRKFEEHYPDGQAKVAYSGGRADDGRFLLEGTETWFYENGRKQREAAYRLGYKVGTESYWSRDGRLLWSWEYKNDGTSVWRQFWPDGRLKAESHWRNLKADGPARLWDSSGRLNSDKTFTAGKLVE